MKLSNQALGSLMLALQNSLLQQTDIVPVLKDFNIELDDNGELIVLNPPTFKASFREEEFIDEGLPKFVASDS